MCFLRQDGVKGGLVIPGYRRLKVIPLGGIGEIGKNMMVLEYDEDIVVIDAGLMLPQEFGFGIDFVIPDISYLVKNRDRIRGIVITHGHEDHIGALPYILPEIGTPPIYATNFTMALIRAKLDDKGVSYGNELNVIKPMDRVRLGVFTVEFIRVCHSIPDGVGLKIHTPVGIVVHTGDFKMDQSPVDGELMDYYSFVKTGREGVLLLMSDSTNATYPGVTPSEREVGKSLENVFDIKKGRIIVASFASNVHRIQQVLMAAFHHNRKVFLVGRSLINIVSIAEELGYISIPEGLIAPIETIHSFPPNRIVVITTGSQGESLSGLVRMARGEHRYVDIGKGDVVIISATPIPGNEYMVNKVVNRLFLKGADVVYADDWGLHVSGHGGAEELKMMLTWVKPKYFVPIHGEPRHILEHANLAEEVGVDRDNIFILRNGDVLELDRDDAFISGHINVGAVSIEGSTLVDVNEAFMVEKVKLANNGAVFVSVGVAEDGKLKSLPSIKTIGVPDIPNEIIDRCKQAITDVVNRGLYISEEEVESAITNSIRKLLKRAMGITPVVIGSVVRIE